MEKILQAVTEYRALGTVVEEPTQFEIETSNGKKKTLSIYPLQLGRLAMISQRLLELDLVDSEGKDDVKYMFEICASKATQVAEIIAIATLRTKEEIEREFKERTEEILNSPTMTPSAVSVVLFSIVRKSYFGDFTKAIRSVEMLRVEVCPKTSAERIAYTGGKPYGDESTK